MNKIDIGFIGELWRSGNIKEVENMNITQLHDIYTLGAGNHWEDPVVGY